MVYVCMCVRFDVRLKDAYVDVLYVRTSTYLVHDTDRRRTKGVMERRRAAAGVDEDRLVMPQYILGLDKIAYLPDLTIRATRMLIGCIDLLHGCGSLPSSFPPLFYTYVFTRTPTTP